MLYTIVIPFKMKPEYAILKKISYFLSRIVVALILTLAYYLLITPVALIKRLFSGRPLPVKPDKDALSYWVARDEPVQPKERFLKRY